MFIDGSIHQLPDIDRAETAEWLDSLDAVPSDATPPTILAAKLVSRLDHQHAFLINRNATSFGSDGDCRTSNRSCTAVESLLTFCPPGPDERTKLSSSSDSSMLIWSVMRIMTCT